MCEEDKRDFIIDSINELKEELPLVLTVKDLKSLLPIGRNSLYSILKINEIPNKKVKGKIIIPRDKFLVWLFEDKETREEVIDYEQILS